jgi:serine/threonine protein kinase
MSGGARADHRGRGGRGLHAAHEKKGTDGKPLGIVHRDVSPSNVVVTFDGGVKLVDFGVAKLTAQADLTRTGTLKGKVSYMSPEQCNNDPIDRRSDVFSLGGVAVRAEHPDPPVPGRVRGGHAEAGAGRAHPTALVARVGVPARAGSDRHAGAGP